MINYSLVKRYAKVGDDTSAILTYGTAQTVKTMTLMEFAKHIAEHGSVYGRSDVQAILTQAVDCLREQLLNGMKVSLGELGDFSISLHSKGVKDANNYNPSVQVKSIRVIWTPGMLFKNLAEEAEYNLVPTLREKRALLKAVKAGQTTVDLSRPVTEDENENENENQNENGGSTGSPQENGGSQSSSTQSGGGTQSGGNAGGNSGSGNPSTGSGQDGSTGSGQDTGGGGGDDDNIDEGII